MEAGHCPSLERSHLQYVGSFPLAAEPPHTAFTPLLTLRSTFLSPFLSLCPACSLLEGGQTYCCIAKGGYYLQHWAPHSGPRPVCSCPMTHEGSRPEWLSDCCKCSIIVMVAMLHFPHEAERNEKRNIPWVSLWGRYNCPPKAETQSTKWPDLLTSLQTQDTPWWLEWEWLPYLKAWFQVVRNVREGVC